MKILVADDNIVFQNVLKSMLASWGYDVVIASGGNEAWSILQEPGAPRLAILDWMMPGLDGLDVCRMARANRSVSYVYILILTARTQGDDLLVAMEAGADDYVTKPFKSQELRARLRAGCRIVELEEQVTLVRRTDDEQGHTAPTLAGC
jgi:two-component system, cell cycle response regulator